jgi:hypothetical protein
MNAAELDARLLRAIAAWNRGGDGYDEAAFDEHARALFVHQVERNEPYARFARSFGFSQAREPASWREIPAVPSSAFKDAVLATFDVTRAELEFHTSGTTSQRSGRHFVERAGLYDAAALAGFDRFILRDRPLIRFLNLVPNPRLRKHSSLGYMVGLVSVLRGDGAAAYFLEDDAVDVAGFSSALEAAIRANRAVCITGTAFALVALLDALDVEGRRFVAAPGSRIMETGGFKGRARVVSRDELYGRLEGRLGIPQPSILAEYGMTELLSQLYDGESSRTSALRVKVAPPWLRTLVVDGDGREAAFGDVGFLRHVDLANRSSVAAVQTEDRGYAVDGGIVLLGRDLDAQPRGCSLDSEDLLDLRETARR